MAEAANHYRFERKFYIDQYAMPHVEAIVRRHPAMFITAYPGRFVNNIYFDTHDLKCVSDTIDGAADRIKVRIRWYGRLFGQVEHPTLELKIKHGSVGDKKSFPLDAFTFEPDLDRCAISALLQRADLPGDLPRRLMNLQPSLVNRYYRVYYQSADKRFRITLDHQMESFHILASADSARRHTNRCSVVLELKYDPRHDQDAWTIAGHFPFRLSRHSKYLCGIEKAALV